MNIMGCDNNLSGAISLCKDVFTGRVLAYDEKAAKTYARIISRVRTKGRAISIADGQIAAIAMVHGYAVATRDTAPFEAAGVAYINPWEA